MDGASELELGIADALSDTAKGYTAVGMTESGWFMPQMCYNTQTAVRSGYAGRADRSVVMHSRRYADLLLDPVLGVTSSDRCGCSQQLSKRSGAVW